MRFEPDTVASQLREKHLRNGIFIDTNLLVLLFVGYCKLGAIKGHRRLAAYTDEDFYTLEKFIEGFKALYCTPNVMTEVSNLIDRGERSYLREFVPLFEEHYVPSSDAVAPEHAYLGITDATIITYPQGKGLLYLTDDLDLFEWLQAAGRDAVNFNHVRKIEWEI